MLAILNYPPDLACRAFAFIMNEFALAQCSIVGFTAMNAFQLVVLGKKMSLGKYDWKLIVFAFGTPIVVNTVLQALQLMGPAEAWSVKKL